MVDHCYDGHGHVRSHNVCIGHSQEQHKRHEMPGSPEFCNGRNGRQLINEPIYFDNVGIRDNPSNHRKLVLPSVYMFGLEFLCNKTFEFQTEEKCRYEQNVT